MFRQPEITRMTYVQTADIIRKITSIELHASIKMKP